ncbi:Hypothetical protein PHPALM_212, partial [Phytophthora palmivora]
MCCSAKELTILIRSGRFHRGLNAAFSTLPNIFTFVATIRRISQDYVAKIASVVAGRRKKGNAKYDK